MEYNLINLPNEEITRRGTIFIQPNLKKIVELLSQEHIVIDLLDIDNAYIKLGISSDKLVDGKYTFTPDDIKFIVINPPKKDSSKEKNYHRLCLELAIMNRYIPIYDNEKNLLYRPEHFEYIRNQMSGLSHYGTEDKFEIASDDELVFPTFNLNGKTYDINSLIIDIEKCMPQTVMLRDSIISTIEDKLDEEDIDVDTELHNNPSSKVVEILDIGSTGRGTNIPGDGDFDFMFRISDKNYMGAIEHYISIILDAFGLKKYDVVTTGTNDLRLKGIYIPGIDEGLAVDITFAEKSNKVNYSTEMCVQDRLNTIKEKYPDKYYYVLANIILAKEILKDFKAYKKKSAREDKQGGMGGIGVETWVLQHNGSFLRASNSFLSLANRVAHQYGTDIESLVEFAQNDHSRLINNVINDAHGNPVEPGYDKLINIFKTFQAYYPVYDFGQSHKIGKANSKRNYPHDDFIYNMNAVGFYKMIDALLKYTYSLEIKKDNVKSA